MRKIKFRAWDKQKKEMITSGIDFSLRELNYPHKHEDNEKFGSDTIGFVNTNEKYFDIMQYTGLKDKKGVEIYEGDIFTVNGKYPKIVRYIESIASFCVANIDDLKNENYKDIWQNPMRGWWDGFSRDIEIIGNIHQNPELKVTK